MDTVIPVDDALDQLLSELRCSICLEQLREAVMLPCSHRFCRECVEQVKSGACPMCKQAFTRRQMVRDVLCDGLAQRAAALRAALLLEREAAPSARKRARTRTAEETRLDELRAQFNARERARELQEEEEEKEEEEKEKEEEREEEGEAWEGRVTLLCTGLDEDAEQLAQQLVRARGDGSKVLSEWTSEVTHTVCGADAEGRARRTLKYLCALAAGAPVLAPSFLRRWRARGAPPRALRAHLCAGEGPARALRAAAPLLRGLAVALVEPLDTPREALAAVLDAAGARCVRVAPDVVLCAQAPPLHELPHAAALWLHPSWLLDSAAAHLQLPKDDYGSIVVPDEYDDDHHNHNDDDDDNNDSRVPVMSDEVEFSLSE